MSMPEAKKQKETESEKKVEENRKPVRRIAMIALGIIVFIAIVIRLFYTTQTLSTTSRTASTKPKILSMPSNGDSEHMIVPSGCAPYFTGMGFTTYCVYTDGRIGMVGDTIHPCGDGPMLYVFVRDVSGKPNSVTYEFKCRR